MIISGAITPSINASMYPRLLGFKKCAIDKL